MSGEASKAIDKSILWGGGRSPFSMSYGKMMMWLFLLSDALTFGSLLTAMGFMKSSHAALWPNSEEVFYHFPFVHHMHLPLIYVAFMTFILIISSVTMVLAVEAGHRKDKKGVVRWLMLTVLGGAIFLGSQAWEWATFINGNGEHSLTYKLEDGSIAKWTSEEKTALRILGGETVDATMGAALVAEGRQISGANLKENEYGHPLYADFFFGITGFHGFHVASGVVINLIILINVMRGVYDKRGHFEMVEKTGLYWHFVDLVWVFVFTFFYLI